jgi:hypothetical protein
MNYGKRIMRGKGDEEALKYNQVRQGGKDAISRCGEQGGIAGTGQCKQQREA